MPNEYLHYKPFLECARPGTFRTGLRRMRTGPLSVLLQDWAPWPYTQYVSPGPHEPGHRARASYAGHTPHPTMTPAASRPPANAYRAAICTSTGLGAMALYTECLPRAARARAPGPCQLCRSYPAPKNDSRSVSASTGPYLSSNRQYRLMSSMSAQTNSLRLALSLAIACMSSGSPMPCSCNAVT